MHMWTALDAAARACDLHLAYSGPSVSYSAAVADCWLVLSANHSALAECASQLPCQPGVAQELPSTPAAQDED